MKCFLSRIRNPIVVIVSSFEHLISPMGYPHKTAYLYWNQTPFIQIANENVYNAELTVATGCFWYFVSYDLAGVEDDGRGVKLHGLGDLALQGPDLQRKGGHGEVGPSLPPNLQQQKKSWGYCAEIPQHFEYAGPNEPQSQQNSQA